MTKHNLKRLTREIEVKGHLIDSMILTKIFDRVMDLKGDFVVKDFRIGRGKKDHSYAKLAITGRNKSHLDKMLQEIYRAGGVAVELQNVEYVKVKKDFVLPDNFYSTTNNPTFVYSNKKWIT